MNPLHSIFMAAFFAAIGLVAYTWLIYPLCVAMLSRSFGRTGQVLEAAKRTNWPRISLLIAAHNEEAVIERRVLNALAMDYPSELVEIIVACDGCCDATAEIVGRYADRGVKVLDYPRRGKATTLNAAMGVARGEIVLLSDANTDFEAGAVRKLVRWFDDPAEGSVCGRLVLTDPKTGNNVDSLYWRYETFLKKCEGRLGALLGANGAIYAIRRSAYVPIPDGTIVDDFVIPLLAKLRNGGRIEYEAEAVAFEQSAPSVAAEFGRRTRIGAGAFQSIPLLWRLLHPRHGWTAFAFLSHKLLRWFCPFLLVVALGSSLVLACADTGQRFYQVCVAAQLGALVLSLAAMRIAMPGRLLKPLRLAGMFTSMNVALLLGFVRWLRGRQHGAWKRTQRSAAEAASTVLPEIPADNAIARRPEVPAEPALAVASQTP